MMKNINKYLRFIGMMPNISVPFEITTDLHGAVIN